MTENTATTTTAAPAEQADDSNLEALKKQSNFGLYSKGTIVHEQEEKDWTYLAKKEPSSNHHLQARLITELSGIEISAQQCMALLAMHRWIQKSEANRERPEFKGRTVDSVLKGSETLAQRAAEIAAKQGEKAPIVQATVPVRVEVPTEDGEGTKLVEDADALPAEEAKPEAPAKPKPRTRTKSTGTKTASF